MSGMKHKRSFLLRTMPIIQCIHNSRNFSIQEQPPRTPSPSCLQTLQPSKSFYQVKAMASMEKPTKVLEESSMDASMAFTLDSIRNELIRQEDSIVFALIERARLPYNSPAYVPCYKGDFGGRSITEVFLRDAEGIDAKAGRYQNPEEVPFFPEDLPLSLVPPYNFPQVLYPPAASVNESKKIWDIYFTDLLPLFTTQGDDGNYATTAALDRSCLQVISRRIHYGRFVAEVKFRDAPQDYTPAIRAKDRDTLMKLLTFESVEEMVKRRVEKKALVFGQDVALSDNATSTDGQPKQKIDPKVIYRLYAEWVIPLTKVVEVEYLLRRLH